MHHVVASQSRRARSKQNLKTLQMLAASGVLRRPGGSPRAFAPDRRYSSGPEAHPHEVELPHLLRSTNSPAPAVPSCRRALLLEVSQLIKELPKRLWAEFAPGPHKAKSTA